MFSPSSRNRLTRHDLGRFLSETLFDRIARVVCETECLPRKELYEAWEVARRTRRLFRGGRVIEPGGGHGLVSHIMLLLDDTSPSATIVDPAVPESAAALHAALVRAWPRLDGRITFLPQRMESIELRDDDVVVSCHACGALTDRVLDLAATAHVRVAVLPCCHDLESCDAGPLTGWMDASMAIDAVRAVRLEQRGYRVRTQVIPDTITPKNRLLLGEPC